MIPKHIIEKAIDGGYQGNITGRVETILDPLFWQALGKVLGWKGVVVYKIDEQMKHQSSLHIDGGWDVWEYEAHNFLELLLRGGDTEKFWQDLIKN